jgi:PIN domain nuclease of toxin-antitoxin system
MATMVLDAHALIVLFNDEPGADAVEKLLLKAESGTPELLMSVVNLGRDLLLDSARRFARDRGREISRDCRNAN